MRKAQRARTQREPRAEVSKGSGGADGPGRAVQQLSVQGEPVNQVFGRFQVRASEVSK